MTRRPSARCSRAAGARSSTPAWLGMLAAAAVPSVCAAQQTRSPDPAPAPTQPADSLGLLPVIDYSGDLSTRPRLSGGWNGSRNELSRKGVTLDLDWTQVGQGVVSGGRRIDWDYGGSFDALLQLDLYRMGVLDGAGVKFRVESRYGESVNDDAGTLLPVNNDGLFPLTARINEPIVSITELNYVQYFAKEFAITIGKFQTLDGDPNEFASGRGRSQFMNSNFIFNGVSARTVPYSTLGGGILVNPTERISISSVVVSTADSSTTSGFENFNKGWTWSTEADLQYRVGTLPGGFNVAGIYAFDGDFTQLGGKLRFARGSGVSVESKSDSWCMYASAWQYLFAMDPAPEKILAANGRPELRGVGLFARAGFADHSTNPVEWSASGGIGGRGVIPSRDNDTFGIGYCYSRLHEPRAVATRTLQDNGRVFEAFYNAALAPSVGLTFDVQWAQSGFASVSAATVLAVRLDVRF